MDHAAHPPLPSPLPAGRAAAAGRGRLLLIALVTLPVVMLVFFLFFFKAFYGLWCRMSGTQLSPNNPAAALAPTVHTGRFITINFEGSPYDGLPVRFYPDQAEIQYEVGGKWHTATGRQGTVTQAELLFLQRSGESYPFADVDQAVRKIFHLADGALRPVWDLNDFGNYSWNMMQGARRTAYYIHTTPDDEAATAEGRLFLLSQSHGCVHIRPADRKEMMDKGYLKKDTKVEVKPYGEAGPP